MHACLYTQDMSRCGAEARLDDYEEMPIHEFGKALMRGMGWKDGEALGGRRPPRRRAPPTRAVRSSWRRGQVCVGGVRTAARRRGGCAYAGVRARARTRRTMGRFRNRFRYRLVSFAEMRAGGNARRRCGSDLDGAGARARVCALRGGGDSGQPARHPGAHRGACGRSHTHTHTHTHTQACRRAMSGLLDAHRLATGGGKVGAGADRGLS